MPDLSKLTLTELREDFEMSHKDASACVTALAIGVYDYDSEDGVCSVQERLNVNRRIMETVLAELKRRNNANSPCS